MINLAIYERYKGWPGYDKMGCSIINNTLQGHCQNAWNVGKFATIDEMMI